MKDIEKYKRDFKAHLESEFSASKESDKTKKLADTEKTVIDYMNNYIANSELNVTDIKSVSQSILDDFAKNKIKYIE